MESPDEDLQASCPKFPGQVGCAGELIGLDPNQCYDGAAIREPVGPYDLADRYRLNGIVIKLGLKLDFPAQQLVLGNILGQAGKASKCVTWEYAAKMTNDVSLIIIFRWLDEDDPKPSAFG
jgi:hypothetical protein